MQWIGAIAAVQDRGAFPALLGLLCTSDQNDVDARRV